MKRKFPRKQWFRDGKRLVRLEEYEVQDDEVLILKSDAIKAIENHIVQHSIPKKKKCRRTLLNTEQISELITLPSELLLKITTYIEVKDVENVGKTCRDLNIRITNMFIPRVVLPLSQSTLNELGGKSGRFILSLTSSLNIRMWNVGSFETMLRNMNLKYLKEVKFVGNNYGYSGVGGLIGEYKCIMRNIFLNKKYVRKMDVSLDSSIEYCNLLETLRNMLHLEELHLRTCSNASQYDAMPTEMTLNEILNNTLSELQIKTLELKGFNMHWGIHYESYYGLQIISKSIEVLHLEYGKMYELEYIEAENLKDLKIENEYLPHCLFHTRGHSVHCLGRELLEDDDDTPERPAVVLARGCPKLEQYNGMDLNVLRAESATGNWLEVLENHKGRGVQNNEECHCCYRNRDH